MDLFLGCACMRQNQALHAETGTGILQREARVLIKTSAQRLSLSLSLPPPIPLYLSSGYRLLFYTLIMFATHLK